MAGHEAKNVFEINPTLVDAHECILMSVDAGIPVSV